MKSQRAWMTALWTILALTGVVSTATAGFPWLHRTPGFHPASHPYAVMMGQDYYDPTYIGAEDYGDTCCGPSWYDISVDALYMKRDDAGRQVPITSDGPDISRVVMGTGDLDFDFEPGLRATIRHQLSAAYNVEAGYLGVVDWGAQAVVTGDDTLYSVFSDFGSSPNGGIPGIDQASLHRIRYNSHVDSVELNLRRTWSHCSNRFHASWFSGLRWLKLRDKFFFFADVEEHNAPGGGTWPAGQTDIRVLANNDLYGGQLGGHLGACICPGLIVNGEIKAGAYAVRADVDSQVFSTLLPNTLESYTDTSDIALVSEASAYLTYQIHPLWKIRAGYQFLYVDGVALAGENLNNVPVGDQWIWVNDNGNALMHGGTLGLELGW